MVGFEGGNEPADHPHSDLLGRLLHLDHLEAPRERRVLLEVFFVFGPGRGGDCAQLSAGQGGLEEVGRIPLPGLSAGTDEGVGFVDEENDRHRRLLHLVNHRLEPVFELSLHPGTGLEETEIEGPEDNSLERLRHVPLRDPLRKPLDHRGLSDACLAGQDRVVLTATGEDVDQLTDLGVAAENRVDLSSPCPGGEVDRVLVERRGARGAAGRGRRPLSIRRLSVRSRHRGLDRAVEDRRGIASQLLRGDSPKLIRDRQRPPGKRFLPHERRQEPGTADLRQPLIDRGKQPCFLGQQTDFGGEQGGARVPGLQPVDSLAQVSQQTSLVDAEVAKEEVEVVARLFEELDEPVLDFDVVIRPRQAESGGPFERPLALGIELADEILEIEAGHWSVSLLGKSMIRLVRRPGGTWS